MWVVNLAKTSHSNSFRHYERCTKGAIRAAKRQHQPKPCPCNFLKQGLFVKAVDIADLGNDTSGVDLADTGDGGKRVWG